MPSGWVSRREARQPTPSIISSLEGTSFERTMHGRYRYFRSTEGNGTVPSATRMRRPAAVWLRFTHPDTGWPHPVERWFPRCPSCRDAPSRQQVRRDSTYALKPRPEPGRRGVVERSNRVNGRIRKLDRPRGGDVRSRRVPTRTALLVRCCAHQVGSHIQACRSWRVPATPGSEKEFV